MPEFSFLDIHPEVANTLSAGMPVVALESTIISHGMPYPENLSTAMTLESIVREEGSVPATIAIIGGRIKIGLDAEQLMWLASNREETIHKASRRDMAMLLSQRQHAATTVSATMICAYWAGIRIFATGGIGGVHRGATETFDISADLTELARTPVAVVSAGIKSILDIPATLEYLETQGVPVVCVGSDDFPAFYTRQSGIAAPARLDDPESLARMLQSHWQMKLGGGVLIANPVPQEHSMDAQIMKEAVEQALVDGEREGIKGKAVTPFLLRRVNEITRGDSLVSNIQLVFNNARLAAKIAMMWTAEDLRS